MNNVDYALSIIETIHKPYSNNVDSDEIADFFSKLAMRTIKDEQYDSLNKVIYHDRFSISCHLKFFNDFFNKKNFSSIKNLNNIFSLLLNNNYFDFSAICYGMYKMNVRFFNNQEAFKLLINHLNKNCLYFNQIVSNYEYSPFELKNKKEQKVIDFYMEKSKKYEILSEFLNNGPEGISWSYGSLEEAFEEMKNNRYGINNLEVKEKLFNAFLEIKNISKNRKKQEDILSIIALGLGFSKIGAIGKKINIRKYKKNNSIVVYDATYYKMNDNEFNNPYINFKECLEEFNKIKKCGFSEVQEEKIQNVLINVRKILLN